METAFDGCKHTILRQKNSTHATLLEIDIMTTYCFESPYGIEVTQFNVTRYPLMATIVFTYDGLDYGFLLANPSPLAAITEAFDDCYQIRVVDLNAGGNNYLEFGRYKIELWDEDNALAEIKADQFEQSQISTSADN